MSHHGDYITKGERVRKYGVRVTLSKAFQEVKNGSYK